VSEFCGVKPRARAARLNSKNGNNTKRYSSRKTKERERDLIEFFFRKVSAFDRDEKSSATTKNEDGAIERISRSKTSVRVSRASVTCVPLTLKTPIIFCYLKEVLFFVATRAKRCLCQKKKRES
jgi:hypothetical protein